MMDTQPDGITVCTLECVLMPNGEIISKGKSLGWFDEMKPYLTAAPEQAAKQESDKMRGFKLCKSTDSSSYFVGEVEIIPTKLVAFLGGLEDARGESDGNKVSAEWHIEKNGAQFHLYDYKATTLYDSKEMRPSELWESEEPFYLHIGGNNGHENELKELISLLEDNCGA
jgi:hypothetical protein